MPLIEKSLHLHVEHVVVPVETDSDDKLRLQAPCGVTIDIETQQPELITNLARPGTLTVRNLIEQLKVGEVHSSTAMVVIKDEVEGPIPAFIGIQLDEAVFNLYEGDDLYSFVEEHRLWYLLLFLASPTIDLNLGHQEVAQEQGLTIAIPWIALNVSVAELAHYYEHLLSSYASEIEEWFSVQQSNARELAFDAFLYIEFLNELVTEYPSLVETVIALFSRLSQKSFVPIGHYGGSLRYKAFDK